MISLPFSKDMLDRAKAKANNLGSIRNSILKGRGNLAGYLGEEALAPHIGAEIVSNNRGLDKYNHDLLMKDGNRVEVKTKRRTVKPRSNYDVSVAHTSTHQKPDVYAFISLEFERSSNTHPKSYYGLKNVWLCGFMSAEEYMEKAVIWKKGKVDKTNNFKTHVDMYNLSIDQLHKDITGIEA